ncbi:hypothetical protein BpHYR1_003087 [Brachionus plicatilis]|uniref:Uncharacterized protein n=1 Tax=Brachionus plicatilis TaxID=10195 RepID=A0A3M7PM63_BRAPC|nr:hypothetical protein BpHYR1_003087 [Brachionus plicatilis]
MNIYSESREDNLQNGVFSCINLASLIKVSFSNINETSPPKHHFNFKNTVFGVFRFFLVHLRIPFIF